MNLNFSNPMNLNFSNLWKQTTEVFTDNPITHAVGNFSDQIQHIFNTSVQIAASTNTSAGELFTNISIGISNTLNQTATTVYTTLIPQAPSATTDNALVSYSPVKQAPSWIAETFGWCNVSWQNRSAMCTFPENSLTTSFLRYLGVGGSPSNDTVALPSPEVNPSLSYLDTFRRSMMGLFNSTYTLTSSLFNSTPHEIPSLPSPHGHSSYFESAKKMLYNFTNTYLLSPAHKHLIQPYVYDCIAHPKSTLLGTVYHCASDLKDYVITNMQNSSFTETTKNIFFHGIANVGHLFTSQTEPQNSWNDFTVGCGILAGAATVISLGCAFFQKPLQLIPSKAQLAERISWALPISCGIALGSYLHESFHDQSHVHELSSKVGSCFAGAVLSTALSGLSVVKNNLYVLARSAVSFSAAALLQEHTSNIPVVGTYIPYVAYPLACATSYYGFHQTWEGLSNLVSNLTGLRTTPTAQAAQATHTTATLTKNQKKRQRRKLSKQAQQTEGNQ